MSDQPKVTIRIKGGMPLGALLAIVFTVLKLTGHIAWSWVWVLAPVWIPLGLACTIFLFAVLVLGAAGVLEHRKTRGRP